MSLLSHSISETMYRLRSGDSTLQYIDLYLHHHTDQQLDELIDYLLVHPNIITDIDLRNNQLTDKTGVKLAQLVASSTTILRLDLAHNLIGEATYLAMAAALRVNTSLRLLYLHHKWVNTNCINPNCTDLICINRINLAFVDALILNPIRPPDSHWHLYSTSNELCQLRKKAWQLGHPSMQAMLATKVFGSLI